MGYTTYHEVNRLDPFINRVIEGDCLKVMKNPQVTEKDKFSKEFENSTSNKARHLRGQYFTPTEIVKYILDELPIKRNDRILDPTCGAGAFLSEALKRNGNKIENIFGVDIDSRALNLCKKNLLSTMKIPYKNPHLILGDFFKDGARQLRQFDFVVGNPPFKTLIPGKDFFYEDYKKYQEVFTGPVNAATLTILRGYDLLKDGGYLGFVLPKNLVRVKSFAGLRKFLIKNTEIIKIKDLDHRFKEVRCDQVILILRKKSNPLKNMVEIIPYTKGIPAPSYNIPQFKFERYPFIPLFYNYSVKTLADKLLRINTKLKDITKIYRGVSRSLLSNGNLQLKGIKGDSITKFGIKYFVELSIKKPTMLNNKITRILKDRVVIQNIFSKEGGVFGAVASKNELSLETVTNIIPNSNINPYFILGLLGSKLSNFFMIHVIFLNSNFAMHTDAEYIGQLPIILPDPKILRQVITLTKKLVKIKDKYSEQFAKNYAELNKIVYNLYNLNTTDIHIIENTLSEVMSHKAYGRKNE